tara:strand:+ start:128 stop:598 length:471 start_codon:yes stop_codon:yes gene_type:complete
MKFWIILLFATFGFTLNAQDILVNGVNYEVKNKKILKEGIDVTSSLSEDEKSAIFSAFNSKMDKVKELEKAEKNLKKAEKEQKQAEKRQKKAEKALKQKEKAQSNFEKSGKQYNSAVKKYEKLKDKGKLSPKDEKKWLEKIEKLKEAQAKAKKKLN